MPAADAITATNHVAKGRVPSFTTLGRQSLLPKNRLSEIKKEIETQLMQETQGIDASGLEPEKSEFTQRVRGREESCIPKHKVREREVSFISSRDIPKSYQGFIHTNPSVSALNDQYIQSLREQLNATTDHYMSILSYQHRPMQCEQPVPNVAMRSSISTADLPPADDDQIRNGHFEQQINEPESNVEYQRLNRMYRNCCDARQEREEQTSLKIVGNLTEKLNEMAEMKRELLTSLKIVGHLNKNLHKRSECQKRCENEMTEIKHQIKHESESLRKIQKQNEQILQQTQKNKRSEEISRQLSKLSKINRMIRTPRATNPAQNIQICHEVADGKLLCQTYAPEQVIRHRAAYDSNLLMNIPEIHDLSITDMVCELDTVSLEQEIQRRKDCRKYSRIQRARLQRQAPMNVPEIQDLSEADIMRRLSKYRSNLGKINKSGKCVR